MNVSQTLRNLPAVKARAQVPLDTRRKQWQMAVPGAALVAVGFVLPKYLGFPWQAGLGVSAFGAFMVDHRMVLDFAKAVAQLVGALGGRKPDAD